MNPEMTFQPTVDVTWNALETTILAELWGDKEWKVHQQAPYCYEDMRQLNGRLARAMDPADGDWTVPERFHQEDHTGKVPLKDLFDKTETLLANLDRARTLTDTFRYNSNDEV